MRTTSIMGIIPTPTIHFLSPVTPLILAPRPQPRTLPAAVRGITSSRRGSKCPRRRGFTRDPAVKKKKGRKKSLSREFAISAISLDSLSPDRATPAMNAPEIPASPSVSVRKANRRTMPMTTPILLYGEMRCSWTV